MSRRPRNPVGTSSDGSSSREGRNSNDPKTAEANPARCLHSLCKTGIKSPFPPDTAITRSSSVLPGKICLIQPHQAYSAVIDPTLFFFVKEHKSIASGIASFPHDDPSKDGRSRDRSITARPPAWRILQHVQKISRSNPFFPCNGTVVKINPAHDGETCSQINGLHQANEFTLLGVIWIILFITVEDMQESGRHRSK